VAAPAWIFSDRGSVAVWTMHSASPALDRTRRNAKIVKLLRARKLTMAEIGGMYGLSTGTIALIAKAHGASRGVRPFDPLKVRKAIRLINRGMPVSHAAQIVDLRADSLMIYLEKRGLYERQAGRNRPWTDREVRVLRRDYGKPGHSLLSIGAALDRTDHEVASKAHRLGLRWRPKRRDR
jgi:hypothetical protein